MNQPDCQNGHGAWRYAFFCDVGRDYLLKVYERDFETAPRWGGFVRWFGGVRST